MFSETKRGLNFHKLILNIPRFQAQASEYIPCGEEEELDWLPSAAELEEEESVTAEKCRAQNCFGKEGEAEILVVVEHHWL